MTKWTRVNFHPNLPLKKNSWVTASKEHTLLSKETAKEGMVLLKNENHILPLTKGTRVALFGKGSFDYVKGGGGSGNARRTGRWSESLRRCCYCGYQPLFGRRVGSLRC